MKKMISKAYYSALFALYSGMASAYDIGAPDSGVFQKMGDVVQDVVDFVEGPAALAFSFASIVGAAVIWVVAPRFSGIMGYCMRAVIAVIVVLNATGWITYLNTSST